MATSARAAALWTGFAAAAIGAFGCVVVALLFWIPDAAATGTTTSTMRAGVLTFLTAQRGGLRLNGVAIGFAPLGLTVLAGWLCWRSTRVLMALPVVADDLRPPRLWRLVGLQSVGYTLTCIVLIPFAHLGTSHAPLLGVAIGSCLLSLVSFGASMLRRTDLGGVLWSRLPDTGRIAVRGGLGAALVLLTGGALLAAGSTLVHGGRFLSLTRSLGGGITGLPVASLDVMAAPNAVVAATAYLTGPGFAVGSQSTYSPFGGQSGVVPGFPVLAGLPVSSDASGPVLALIVLVVLAAGIVAGQLVSRGSVGVRLLHQLRSAASAAVVAGLLLGVLAWLAGGRLGAHRLSAVGASPWQVTLAVAGEVAVVTTVTVLVGWARGRGSADLSTALPRASSASAAPAAAAPAPAAPVPAAAAPAPAAPVPAAAAAPAVSAEHDTVDLSEIDLSARADGADSRAAPDADQAAAS